MNAHPLRNECSATIVNDPRWHQVMSRAAAADGRFYYGVRTTGVYCRPSCAARAAKPENVVFYATQEAARRAGLRPCKRCKPERMEHADFVRQLAEPSSSGSDGITGVRRDDAVDRAIRFAVGECFLGTMLVAESAVGLCAILIGSDAQTLTQDLQRRFPQANLIGGDAVLEQRLAQVAMFLETPTMDLAIPLDVRGSVFQRRVWQVLREIPVGVTVSYANVAERIGSPKAVRAVAQACAANPLAVVIPCHRVVRSDGALSGYAWGVERKRALLAREAEA